MLLLNYEVRVYASDDDVSEDDSSALTKRIDEIVKAHFATLKQTLSPELTLTVTEV